MTNHRAAEKAYKRTSEKHVLIWPMRMVGSGRNYGSSTYLDAHTASDYCYSMASNIDNVVRAGWSQGWKKRASMTTQPRREHYLLLTHLPKIKINIFKKNIYIYIYTVR